MARQRDDSELQARLDALQASELQVRSELAAAVEREHALARITQGINQHPLDVDGTLAAIAEAARQLTDGDGARVYLLEGEMMVPGPGVIGNLAEDYARYAPLNNVNTSQAPLAMAVRHRRTIKVDDLSRVVPQPLQNEVLRMIRSVIATPLRYGDDVLGSLNVVRAEVRPFTDSEQATLEAFAAQAANAIATARTQRALAERNREITDALDRQTAMAEVLEIISRSPTNLQAALDAIVLKAGRLLASNRSLIVRMSPDGTPGWVSLAIDGALTREARIDSPTPILVVNPLMLDGSGTEMLFGGPESIEATRPAVAEVWRRFGVGSSLGTPLRTARSWHGMLIVSRPERDPYTPEQIALFDSFGAQAVIAIENARLFADLEQSNSSLAAAVEREGALSRIAQRINQQPLDVDGTLQMIAESARGITRGDGALIALVDGDHVIVGRGLLGQAIPSAETLPLSSDAEMVRAIRERRSFAADDLHDVLDRAAPLVREHLLKHSMRSFMVAPLGQGERVLGSLSIVRTRVEPFTEAEIRTLESFAAQGAIAIETARAQSDLAKRNEELARGLERETVTAEILRVISQSAGELAGVMQEIGNAVRQLCAGDEVVIGFLINDTGEAARALVLDGNRGLVETSPDGVIPEPEVQAQLAERGFFQFVGPVDEMAATLPRTAALQRRDGHTEVALLGVPLLSGSNHSGFIAVSRHVAKPFDDTHVVVLKHLAAQAVIAIENAQVFNQLQLRNKELSESNRLVNENLERQEVLSGVLKIIASAPTSLETTLPQIAAAAARLCPCLHTSVTHVSGGVARIWDTNRGYYELSYPLDALYAGNWLTAAMEDDHIIEVAGAIEDWEAEWPTAARIQRRTGLTSTSALIVPLRGQHGRCGAIIVIRDTPTAFSPRHRTIIQILADQAVIAIENARLFNELQSKTAELEVASRHKSEFLATMSHELRTPLNAIIGYAELLQEECSDLGNDDMLPDLGRIHSAGKHLLSLINQILDLSKVEAGRMTMFLEDFEISALIQGTESIVRPLVEKNGNTFIIEQPDDPGTMRADLLKMRQVLFNLLSNAAKFTERGNVTLSIQRDEQAGRITFAVRDTGIGITDAQKSKLFEAFSQAGAETSRKYGGTGLGLALSRQFCLMMGGDIAVESIPGEGSTFSATLPLRVAESLHGYDAD